MKGHKALARAISACDIATMFGVMGDANMLHITDYIRDGGRFVNSVHEAGAVSMADGFGRLSGTVGIATVTHGPGLTNTLTPLVEAVRARSRLILITAETMERPNLAQQFDIRSFANVAGADYRRVTSAELLGREVTSAIRATAEARRPLVLNVPMPSQLGEVGEEGFAFAEPYYPLRSQPDRDAIANVVRVLLDAKRPLVLIGRGAVESGGVSAIQRLATHLGAPVATTLLAQGSVSSAPLSIDVMGGLSTPLAKEVVQSSDCIISFGASLNPFTTDGKRLIADKVVVQIDDRVDAFGRFCTANVEVLADARLAAEELLGALEDVVARPGDDTLAERIAVYDRSEQIDDTSATGTIDIRTATAVLDRLLPEERLVVTDGGRQTIAAWRFIRSRHAWHFTHTASFGSIGLGIPTAIGAALAQPDSVPVAICGDGGGMMSIIEFSTAVREQIPIVVVVMNDGCYGSEYTKLDDAGVDPAYSLMNWPSFAELAVALGGDGVRVTSIPELEAAIQRASELRWPLLIEVVADPAENPERPVGMWHP